MILIHQSHGDLHPQDPTHRIVDASHRHRAILRRFLQLGDEVFVALGHHHHIHAGVDRHGDLVFVIAGQRVDGSVIRNQEAFESQLVLQDFRKQPLAARTFQSVPTAVGRHDRTDSRAYGGNVSLQMDLAQRLFVQARVALIQQMRSDGAAPISRAAIADVVLGASQDRQRVGQIVALQTAHGRRAQILDALGFLGVAFVSAAPADVARHRNARRETPVDSSGADFHRRDALDLFDQPRIARAAQPDVVRENNRA